MLPNRTGAVVNAMSKYMVAGKIAHAHHATHAHRVCDANTLCSLGSGSAGRCPRAFSSSLHKLALKISVSLQPPNRNSPVTCSACACSFPPTLPPELT